MTLATAEFKEQKEAIGDRSGDTASEKAWSRWIAGNQTGREEKACE